MTNRAVGECEHVCAALEATSGADSVLAQLPAEMRDHVRACEACRTFADELAEARRLLGARESGAEPGPFFLARVMASIAAREAQLERSAQTWAAVPRLASRLMLLASLCLLIAATWVYQMPAPSTVAGWNAQQWAGLVDTSASQDDLLVASTADKK